jgi:hypothetical protein
MSGPLIHISTYTIKGGKLEECKKRLAELVGLVETNEPRLIAFHSYLDEQGNKVSIVQVHPDSASMEFHMEVISEHLSDAFDYLDKTVSEQVYGAPSDTLSEMLRKYADPSAPPTFMPVHQAGFTRSTV